MVLVVVSYDIVDDKRRNKVAKVLLDYGKRVQHSVFETTSVEKLPEIKERIKLIIDIKSDKVCYYPLCKRCRDKIETDGLSKVILTDPDHYII